MPLPMTMFGGRNKKRARKREERKKQDAKQKRQRKRNELKHIAKATANGNSATTTTTMEEQQVSSEEEDIEPIVPERKISRTKRKKLERLEADREKKKQRNALFEQLKQNAISSTQQQFLEKTSQMGTAKTLKQRLTGDLMKQRAGMEIDMETSRLAVATGGSSSSSAISGKWTKHSLEVPKKESKPFGVSSSEEDSDSDEQESDSAMNNKYNQEKPAPIVDPHADLIVIRDSIVEKNATKKIVIDSYATSSSSSSSSTSTTSSSSSNSAPRAPSTPSTPSYYVEVNRTPEIQEQRSNLPVCGMEQEIMEAIQNNSFVLLCGETGSGKTTQVPQFLFEAGYGTPNSPNPGMIGITQPRRVAALSVAKRVAEEMALPYGGPNSRVAHQVRYDARTVGTNTSIKFMTDGILLKEIQSDFLLSKYSAVILDEAHERNLNTDILLGLLSRIVPLRKKLYHEQQIKKRKKGNADANQNEEDQQDQDNQNIIHSELKVIIMSATLKVEDFADNKRLFPTKAPPIVRVEGRTHPVTMHFSRKTEMEDYSEAVFQKISKIHRKLPQGGILVFMTGQREIEALCKRLRDELGVGGNGKLSSWGQGGDDDDDDVDIDWSASEGEGDDDDNEDNQDNFDNQDTTENKNKKNSKDQKKTGNVEDDKNIHLLQKKKELPITGEEPEIVLDENEDIEHEEDENIVPILKFPPPPPPSTSTSTIEGVHVLPLYARLSQTKQGRIFDPTPEGKRLIVISTNVAETSITIPGIRYVVDAGRSKEREYEVSTGMSSFVVQWISRSSAEQRKGRAGRVGPGHCYRLYSSAVYNDTFQQDAPPEILQRPIEDVLLTMKAMEINDVERFPFPTPPDAKGLEEAMNTLSGMGALNVQDGSITNLGSMLAKFPVAARYAKMLILASERNILPYAIATVAGMTVQPPFLYPDDEDNDEDADANKDDFDEFDEEKMMNELGSNRRKKKKRKKDNEKKTTKKSVHDIWKNERSDALSLLRAIGAYSHALETAKRSGKGGKNGLQRIMRAWCDKHHLHERTMREISSLRMQLRRVAIRVLSLSLPSSLSLPPPSSEQEHLLQQVIAAGLLDRIAIHAPAGTFPLINDADEDMSMTDGPTPQDAPSIRRAKLLRLRAAYQSTTLGLARTPLYVPRTSFVTQLEVKRLPSLVCYNEIVTSGEDKKGTVHMRGITVIDREWLPRLSVGTSLCEFPPPAASDPPTYDTKQDCMTCVTRPRFGPHRWELPLTTVPMSRTTLGMEQECRWFLRALLEGKVITSSLFINMREHLKISPAVITHSRFHGLGLQLVNAALEHGVVSKSTLTSRLQKDRTFLERPLRLWGKDDASSIKCVETWRKIVNRLLR